MRLANSVNSDASMGCTIGNGTWEWIGIGFIVSCAAGIQSVAGNQPEPERTGKELVRALANNIINVIYTFDANGYLHPHPIRAMSFDSILRFYADPSVSYELELVGAQDREFQALVTEWSSRNKAIADELETISSDNIEQRNESVRKIQALDGEMQEKFEHVMLDYQADRLYQIQARFLLRTHGFRNLLILGPARVQFDLSALEQKNLQSAMSRIIPDVRAKALALRDKVVNTWLEPLEPLDRDRVLEAWKELLCGDDPRIEQLSIYFSRELDSNNKRGTSLLSLLLPQFELAIDGTLRHTPLNSADGKQSTFIEVRQLLNYLRAPRLQELLEMSVAQKESVLACNDEFWRRCLVIQKDFDKITGDEASTRRLDRDMEYDEEIEKLAWEYRIRIHAIVLPHQLKELDELVALLWARCEGPVHDLLDGKLGDELDLTDKLREQMSKGVKQVYDDLCMGSREIENFAYLQSIAELDEENQKKIDRLFGRPLSKTPASIQLLLHHLSLK